VIAVVRRAMQRAPRDRFGSAQEFLTALRAARTGAQEIAVAVDAPPVPLPTPLPPMRPRALADTSPSVNASRKRGAEFDIPDLNSDDVPDLAAFDAHRSGDTRSGSWRRDDIPDLHDDDMDDLPDLGSSDSVPPARRR
jgi:hypothetical protein